MATTADDYLAGFGGASASPPRVVDSGNDFGGGPGRPGSRGTGNSGLGLAPAPTQFGEEDITKLLKGLPPERIAAIQRRMQKVGLLPESYKSFGFVESTTRSGFGELLQVANDRGESNWENTLEVLASGAETTLAEERVKRASRRQQVMLGFDTNLNTYERSDPAGVRQGAEAAFRQSLGRKPKPAELDRFVNGFLAREQGSQAQKFAAVDRLTGNARDRALQSLGLDEAQAAVADGAPKGGGGAVDTLLQAIGGQESGGDYGATNGRTGASGKYQIMPANWPKWSAAAGLGKNAPRTGINQEIVAKHRMGMYVERYGQQGAAVAWYGGEGAAQDWLKNPNASRFNERQGNGNEPSINEYAQQVMARIPGGATQGGGSESDDLWDRVQRLIADSPYEIKAGKRTRSYEEQVAAKRREAAGGPKAATPGRSKHGDGRANDLQYSSDKAREWALANASRYGLNFPIYNPKLKRGNDESWHVELQPGAYEGLQGGGPGGVAAAPISENLTVQGQDLGAQATEYARNVNPTETAAYDIGGQFQSLVQILQKGVI